MTYRFLSIFIVVIQETFTYAKRFDDVSNNFVNDFGNILLYKIIIVICLYNEKYTNVYEIYSIN